MKQRSRAKQWAVYGGLGIALSTELSTACLVGYFIGTQIEARWGGQPWWRILLLLLFLSVSIWHLILVLQKVMNKEED